MKPFLRCLAYALVLAGGHAAAADVGRVVLAAGETSALRQGQVVRLAFGAMVQDQDVLRTGAASNLQVRFEDDSYVSLREGSELRVDQFRLGGSTGGGDSAVFRLLKGGVRAVTGLIGRQRNEDYRMETPTATVGIRGTDYAITLCQGDCRNPDGSAAKDGVYGRVIGQSQGTNQIHVSNDTDQKTLGINSNFFVGDRKTGVELLLVAPEFVLSKLEGCSRGGSKGASGGTGSEKASSGGASEESRPSTTPPPLPQLQFVATQDLGPQGGPSVLLTPPSGFTVSFPGHGSLFGKAGFDGENSQATYNGQNQLIGFSDGSISGSLAGGSITDAGSITSSTGQIFTWGRWTGATSVPLYNGSTYVNSAAPLLFLTATGVAQQEDIVGKIGGVATYTFSGGPSPVDGGGNVGSITSTSTTINFTSRQQSMSLGMSFPSILLAGSNMGSALFNLNSTSSTASCSAGNCGEFTGTLSGTCSGGGCASGSASGIFGTGLAGTVGYEFAVISGLVNATKAGEVAFLNTFQANSYTPGPAPNPNGFISQIAFANTSPFVPGMTWTVSPEEATFSGNNLVAFQTSGPSGSLAGGSIAQAGSTPLADGGTMSWGRWAGATSVNAPPTISPGTGLVFVSGSGGQVPTSGTFVYSYAGGPNPTNVNGVSGTFNGGSFNVSFGASSGSLSVNTPPSLTVASATYSMNSCTSGCSFTNQSGTAGNLQFATTCVGGGCSGSPSVNAAGVFVGPNGAGLAVAGQVFSSAPTITFGAGFKR